MRETFRYSKLALAVAMTSGALTTNVYAQAPTLEEVVVTAQKREQSLQDAPIAISAFNAEELEQRGVVSIDDLGTSAPNVKITRSPSNATGATISIRGSATINPAITWEPTVGIYLDGVFIGKNLGGIFEIAELERVEVLRGPQGTLYGKNTVGGAVNLITTKPSGEFGGKVTAGYGNYDLMTGYATIDTPALELGGAGRVMAKVTGSYRTRDGLYDNVEDPYGNDIVTSPLGPVPGANPPSGDDLNDINSKVGRYDILWDASENFEARYTWDYSDIDQAPPKQQLTFFDPSVDLLAGTPFAGFGFPPPEMGDYLTGENDNNSKTSSDQSQFERSKSIGQSLFLTLGVGELGFLGDVTLKYIGNDRVLRWDDQIDIDGTPLNVFSSGRRVDYDQQSHELQMIGRTERVDYVVGVYYFQEESDVFNPINFLPLYGFPTSNNSYGFDNDAVAVFGQADWRPSASALQDRLTLTFGLRWTREEKDSYIAHPDDLTPFAAEADDSFENVSPVFVATWEVNDNMNVYGKLANGWKSGGFNGEAPFEAAFTDSYEPEEVQSIEFGMKSRWFDNRVQFNAAVFENNIQDMQLSIFVSGSSAASIVENAGEATIRGAEFELVMLPMADLKATLNYGYLDAEYDEFIENGVNNADIRDIPYAPEHSASASLEYTFLQADWGVLTGRVDYEFVDRHVPYIYPSQNETSQIGPYQLVNGRITLADMPMGGDQTLKLALWGKNLLDKEYRINTIPFGAWTSSFYGDPRTYGIEATYEF